MLTLNYLKPHNMQKTFNNMWVIRNPYKRIIKGSIAPTRKLSKSWLYRLIPGSEWSYWEQLGYTCIKVNVTFDIVKQ